MHALLVLPFLVLAQERIEDVLSRALAADRDGQLEEAARSYLDALNRKPGLAVLHANLAWVYVRQGRLNEALIQLERAIQLDSRDPSSYRLLGRVLRDLENPERALEAFELAVELDPSAREGYLELADLHQSRRELPQAEEWLTRYLDLDPDDVETLYFLGTVLSYQNELARARAVLEKVIAAEPGHARAWFRKAHVEAQMPTERSSALDSYRKSLELDSTQAYVWYEYGILLDKLSLANDAIAAFERAIALDPDLAEASYALGNSLSRAGRAEEARLQLERFKVARDREARREAEAKRALAAFGRGRALLEENRIDEAILAFLEMTELNPRAHQGYAFLAKAHFSKKEVPVAIAYIRRAGELSQGTSEYPYLLSVFLRARGDLSGALAALDAALALDPKNAILHNARGVLLLEAGDVELSIESLERASTLDPENPAYTLNLALALEKQGLAERAEEALARYREQLGLR
jgi:tetratricopeptide (TPR) repeat protein